MPNWASGWIKVSGKPENVKNFCKLFIFEDEVDRADSKTKKYFARSFIHQESKDFEKENFEDITTETEWDIEFSVDFAWSGYSCLIEGYPQQYKRTCITLKSACKKYNVKVKITTEEPGMGFEEEIIADKNDIKYSSNKMPLFECVCGGKQLCSSDSDLNDITCYECGKNGEGIIKNENK